MKKVFSIILLLSFVTVTGTSCFGSDTLKCKCNYFSMYSREKYEQEIDSVKQTLLTQKYDEVLLIGLRSYSVANCLFIVKTNNKYIGLFYDFANSKKKSYKGETVNKLAKGLLNDYSWINQISMSTVPANKRIDHDYSFFVSTIKSKDKIEICASQLLLANNNSVNALFSSYRDMW